MKPFSVLTLTAAFCATVPAHAAPIRYLEGSFGGEAPIGMTPDRPQDLSPMLLGSLKLHNVMSHINLFAAGQYQLRTELPFTKENKFSLGAEYELPRGFTLYGYAQRWPSVGDNRFVAGIKWSFKSHAF